jgi:hypothetical protein
VLVSREEGCRGGVSKGDCMLGMRGRGAGGGAWARCKGRLREGIEGQGAWVPDGYSADADFPLQPTLLGPRFLCSSRPCTLLLGPKRASIVVAWGGFCFVAFGVGGYYRLVWQEPHHLACQADSTCACGPEVNEQLVDPVSACCCCCFCCCLLLLPPPPPYTPRLLVRPAWQCRRPTSPTTC